MSAGLQTLRVPVGVHEVGVSRTATALAVLLYRNAVTSRSVVVGRAKGLYP